MRVFVTGSGGHIGGAVVAELIGAGHEVVGLVRSEASAEAVTALGAEPLRGDVNDVALLRTTAQSADAVIHLAFDNVAAATGGIDGAADADRLVVRAFADDLEGTGKAFIGIARRTGVSGYIDDGQNVWPAVHTLDLAHLYRLALENAPAGAQLIGAAEPGIPVRDIAESIARKLGVPAVSIPAQAAAEHFAPFPFMGMDITMPNDETRALLGWNPTHATLLEEIDGGHYFG